MANHKLAVGVYAQSLWWTYPKSLKDSESVEKATFRNLWTEENTNYDSQKSYFEEFDRPLPGFCLLLSKCRSTQLEEIFPNNYKSSLPDR